MTALISIWLIAFVDAMQQGTTGLLTPNVTSSFLFHSLTAATGVMAQLIGGISKLTLAKILDVFGRPQGYLLMVCLMTIGLIMMAACTNVETYAAAQVLYWIGYNGISYVVGIFVADTSKLRNRAFYFAFVSSPYIATVWITGPMANSILNTIGFRWGFGIFTIITPIVTLPLYFLFQYNYSKAKKQGLIVEEKSGRTALQSLHYYWVQFDGVGLLLLSGGLALFLLPFSIYSYQYYQWRDPKTIGLLVGGFVTIILFVIWEKYFAKVSFMPWNLLLDRTVVGSCVLAAVLFISFYIWDGYFISFLQVVPNLNVTQTGYIANIYSIGSCFWSLVVGVVIRYSGKFKWIALYFGVPLTILGVGLMINFRQPDVNIGYIIMCQIFIAFAGGSLVITEQLAAMAAVDHQHVTTVLAVQSMCASIGGAIGLSVASAVWTGTFPVKLGEYLPAESQANATMIYADIRTQLSYPVGSPTRSAIEHAYGDAQKFMLIGGTAILVLAIPAVAVWRDYNVKDNKQVKGVVA
jgi:MFS family permease